MPRFVNIDRETPMLLPVDLRDWVGEDHLARFVVELVHELDIRLFKANERGSGSEQYPPSMLLGLLVYAYVTGRFSSRRIEQATYDDVGARYIAANTHPDHDTLCTFRRMNHVVFAKAFVQLLDYAQTMGVLKKFGTVSIDGTKVLANASKHAAVSYERAEEKIVALQQEVEELLKKAEDADTTPLEDGLTVPAEIARREQRIAKLKEARAEIERRAREKAQAALINKETPDKGNVKHGSGKTSKRTEDPQEKAQYNFTDPESSIMKAGSGQHFEQAYNAQLAVDIESMLIVGNRVTNAPNDKEQLAPDVRSVASVYTVNEVIADNGFCAERAIKEVEQRQDGQPTGIKVYASVGRDHHGKKISGLEQHREPEEPKPDAPFKERMSYRLKTRHGKEIYKLRKQTVEPVIGIIKQAMGMRRFMMRGLAKVSIEWDLVSLSYNVKRLYRLFGGVACPALVIN